MDSFQSLGALLELFNSDLELFEALSQHPLLSDFTSRLLAHLYGLLVVLLVYLLPQNAKDFVLNFKIVLIVQPLHLQLTFHLLPLPQAIQLLLCELL